MNGPKRPLWGTRDSTPEPVNRASPPRQQPGMPTRRMWLTFAIVLIANYVLMRTLFPGPDDPIAVPYTAFKEEVAKANVESIYSQGASIEGRFAKPVTWPRPGEAKPAGEAKGVAAKHQRATDCLRRPACPKAKGACDNTSPAAEPASTCLLFMVSVSG